MEKLDYKKEMKDLYLPSAKEVAVVDVPAMRFVMIDGKGDPNISQDFQDAMQALYTISYTIKFMLKKEQEGPEYTVAPAEGLWWGKEGEAFDLNDKGPWEWRLMMMQPPHVSEEIFARALQQARAKKDMKTLGRARFGEFHEGLSVQIMHVGPYSEETPTIEKLHAFMTEKGYAFNGKHHEIYMGDPRKTKPEKLKTVIRQPVKVGKAAKKP
jgi:hypothetical protein